jgi:hypothetical protein
MFAIFRLFSMVSAVVAFIQSPTGRQLIGRVRTFVAGRLDRRRANRAATLPAGPA